MNPKSLGLAVKVGLGSLPYGDRFWLAGEMASPLSVIEDRRSQATLRTSITTTPQERELLAILRRALGKTTERPDTFGNSALIHAALLVFARLLALNPGKVNDRAILEALGVGND